MEMETVNQVARRTGYTPRRVRQMCQGGAVDGASKVGRDWLIPRGFVPAEPPPTRPTTGDFP